MHMDEKVRQRAYQLWEADGRPEGRDQAYWFQAVAEFAEDAAKAIKPASKRKPQPRKKAA